MYLEPREEFKQIFNEGWRNQRDYLYVPNMHGADWPKMREMYGQLLPYAMHRADLNYLMDMMGAEIAIGHSYVRGGDMPSVPQSVGGLLGADFAIENGRYKVTRIYDNESWNPDLRSPLATPGANVNTGARRHCEPANDIDGEQHASDGRRAHSHSGAGGERAGVAHAGLGRVEPPFS
jgi:tricorn protease